MPYLSFMEWLGPIFAISVLLLSRRDAKPSEVCRYEDCVRLLFGDRPAGLVELRGALYVKRPSKFSGNYRVHMLYLDGENNPVIKADGSPLIRSVEARRIDDVFAHLLGEHDLIILR